jgi:hypothetical protein
LFQQLIDQCRFSMVDVRNNSDVAKFHCSEILSWGASGTRRPLVCAAQNHCGAT